MNSNCNCYESFSIPDRIGGAPESYFGLPQRQLTQKSNANMAAKLVNKVLEWKYVKSGEAFVEKGATAFILDYLDDTNIKLSTATIMFLPNKEFAHIHDAIDPLCSSDYSIHAALPPLIYEEAVKHNWATIHPVAGNKSSKFPDVIFPTYLSLIYGPRDDSELSIVLYLIQQSYKYAIGEMN